MDPISTTAIATMIVAAVSPLVEAGWKEVGKVAFKDAYEAIKVRFTRTDHGRAVVEKFEHDPRAAAPAFESALVQQLSSDRDLLLILAKALDQKSGTVGEASLVNQITAGKVIVAREIHGNVTM